MEAEGRGAIRQVLTALSVGRPVVLTDDRVAPSRSQLVMAAESVCAPDVAFFVRWTGGIIQAPLAPARAARLRLPLMAAGVHPPGSLAFTVSVDAATGTSTGISAHDRAATLRLLADPDAGPAAFTRPGHVFPVSCAPGGVLDRPGLAEAAVDLLRAAGRPPVAAAADLVDHTGDGLDGPALARFASEHALPVATVADVAAHRLRSEAAFLRAGESAVTTAEGSWTRVDYAGADHRRHSALVMGPLTGSLPVVAVHVECVTGDVFDGLGCSCREALRRAKAAIARRGRGALLYLRATAAGDEEVGSLAVHLLRDLGLTHVRTETGQVVELSPDSPGSLSALRPPPCAHLAPVPGPSRVPIGARP